jgi:hypothetical protein
MNKTEIFIHVGLHKTGTTFLQRQIYPKLSLAYYDFRPFDEQLTTNHRKRKICISDENYSGRPWPKGFPDRPSDVSYGEQFKYSMHNLVDLYPGAKIIIGFREHSSFLISLYKQYLHEGGTGKLEYFFNPSSERSVIRKEDLLFKSRVDVLMDLFDQQVLVYDQKKLLTNTAHEVERICRFLGVTDVPPIDNSRSMNKGVKYHQANILRILNGMDKKLMRISFLPTLNNSFWRRMRLTPRQICQYKLAGLSKREIRLSVEQSNYISATFADDWSYISTLS